MDTKTKIRYFLIAQLDADKKQNKKEVRHIARVIWKTICEEMTPTEAHSTLTEYKADPILGLAPSLSGRNLW